MSPVSETWDRRCAHAPLDVPTLTVLLQPVFPGCRVEAADLVPSGLCNTNYRVKVAGRDQPVLLRRYVQDPEAWAREARLYTHFAGHVPLPELLYATGHAADGGLPYAVQTWVAGERLAERLPLEAGEAAGLAHELGSILARIASLRLPEPGFLGPDLSVAHPFGGSAVDAYLGELERLLTDSVVGGALGSLVDDVARLVAAERFRFDAVLGASELVHGDYGPRNLLVRRAAAGWQVAAVLDWEFAHAGTSLLDIAILFRRADLLPPTFSPAFALGFTAAGGVLPADWPWLARLLDLVNLAQLLAGAAPASAQQQELVSWIRATVQAWER